MAGSGRSWVVGPIVTWLVTGGAGYIGAHVVHALRQAGLPTVVLDDLSTGLPDRVPDDVPLVRADVRDTVAVAAAFARYRPAGVVHLAARKDVAESTTHPLCYYRDNLDGLRSILTATVQHDVRALLFSSSAAVYGTPARYPVTELDPTLPENPYGRTKLIGEWMVRDAAAGGRFGWAALRYFNVAGAARPELRDIGGTNLVPRLLRAAEQGVPATVFGTDYPTPDGSAIRDYIHVADVADAHLRVALGLASGAVTGDVLNIGRGRGSSVFEMIDAVSRALGRRLPYDAAPRRPGDPSAVVACADLIAARVGWRARFDLDEIVRSAALEFAPV